jgi:hypothetical protein
MLTRDQILKASDLKTADVDVPEWGGTIRVRTMTGTDRANFLKISTDKDGKPKQFMEALIAATAVDDKGEPLFTSADMVELGKKSSLALQKVFEKSADLNGLTQASVEKIAGE